MLLIHALGALIASSALETVAGSQCALLPAHLSVDNKQLSGFDNPSSDLAVVTDKPDPWLSWWLAPAEGATNQTQSAYRIQVATNITGFSDCDDGVGPACVWDSGVVQSRHQGVPFGGAVLPTFSQVVWRVAVWDGAGEPCGFGPEIGAWEVPLLEEAAWHGATWLTRDAPHPPLSDCELYQPDAAPLFRAPLALPPSASVARARAYVTGLGYYTLFVNGQNASDAVLDPGQTSYNETVLYSTLDVTALLRAAGAGGSVVGVALGNGWWNLLPLRCE